MALTDRVATLKGLLPLEALQIIMSYDSHPTADLIKVYFSKMAIDEAEEELEDALVEVWLEGTDHQSVLRDAAWDNLDAVAAKLMTFPASNRIQDLLKRVLRAYGGGLHSNGRQPLPEIIAYLTARDPLFPEIYPWMLKHPDLF